MTAPNAITPFNFNSHDIRVIVRDGEPWFIAKDVCDTLGYSNSRKAIGDHLDDDEKGVTNSDTLGGTQKLTIINESGLYALVLRSRKPEARKFAKWVTSEVLPSIRKTGAYVAPSQSFTVPANLNDTQRVAHAFSLATEVGAVAQRTVFESVLAGDDSWQRDHWLFSLNPTGRGQEMKPTAHPTGRDAILLTMAELIERIANGEMLQSSADLARLAAACNQRLVHRMSTSTQKQPTLPATLTA